MRFWRKVIFMLHFCEWKILKHIFPEFTIDDDTHYKSPQICSKNAENFNRMQRKHLNIVSVTLSDHENYVGEKKSVRNHSIRKYSLGNQFGKLENSFGRKNRLVQSTYKQDRLSHFIKSELLTSFYFDSNYINGHSTNT